MPLTLEAAGPGLRGQLEETQNRFRRGFRARQPWFESYQPFLIIKMKIASATFQEKKKTAISVSPIKPQEGLDCPQQIKALLSVMSEERPALISAMKRVKPGGSVVKLLRTS